MKLPLWPSKGSPCKTLDAATDAARFSEYNHHEDSWGSSWRMPSITSLLSGEMDWWDKLTFKLSHPFKGASTKVGVPREFGWWWDKFTSMPLVWELAGLCGFKQVWGLVVLLFVWVWRQDALEDSGMNLTTPPSGTCWELVMSIRDRGQKHKGR